MRKLPQDNLVREIYAIRGGRKYNQRNRFQLYKTVWHNPRYCEGFRLTDYGLESLVEYCEYEHFYIEYPAGMILLNKTILYLEKEMGVPFHLGKKGITLFSEVMAVQLILFDGDINAFVDTVKPSKFNKYKIK